MVVKITYEKYLDRGEKKVRILKIEGVIEEEKLPIRYLDDNPRFFVKGETLYCSGGKYEMLNTNGKESLTKEEFEWLVKTMKEAGDRLHKINQEIKKERKKWCGKHTIKI